jgi:hypothetical protein
LDPQKSRANSRLQRCRSMANVGVYRLLKSGIFPAAQLKRE